MRSFTLSLPLLLFLFSVEIVRMDSWETREYLTTTETHKHTRPTSQRDGRAKQESRDDGVRARLKQTTAHIVGHLAAETGGKVNATGVEPTRTIARKAGSTTPECTDEASTCRLSSRRLRTIQRFSSPAPGGFGHRTL